MSKFYEEIAKYYDAIFPVGADQVALLLETAGEPPARVLDVACGTGGYALELAGAGHQVTAIDLSPQMVEGLLRKAPRIDARVLDMLDIPRLDRTFDFVYCIGNSLVHLEDEKEIGRFLEGCAAVLAPGGRILLQVVNYDRVLEKDVQSLPPILNVAADLSFDRYYRYDRKAHKIAFRTVLQVEGRTLENEVPLHPVTSAELGGLLEKAGFSDIRAYGGFGKAPYDPMESFALVLTAKKAAPKAPAKRKAEALLPALAAILEEQGKVPALDPDTLDPARTCLCMVDMLNGFTREGALQSPRAEALIPGIAGLSAWCTSRGISKVAFADAHGQGALQFSAYPPHCVAGTPEGEVVEELKAIGGYLLVPKNSTDCLLEPLFQEWLEGHPEVDTFLVTGVCTDICIQQLAIPLKTWFNRLGRPSRILVPVDLVDTFDLGLHQGDLCHAMALYTMALNGVELVRWGGGGQPADRNPPTTTR
ncbi:isochorismatase family protein [Anaerotalea alkaliphila]|uniref:Isochorismatase family protein n=1 Tax=Anaerotalea alkaliphila TaxID=2662126 RepID=A0A7X5HV95_9FIRM|nr:isochorismatase family protein [Anaerotalea alkaliphila]NDL67270.1 isochorismatase family protein [Anaerotalea alkaliphila]